MSPATLKPHRGQRADLVVVTLACLFPSLATWIYFVIFSGQDGMMPAYSTSKVVQFSFPILWIYWVQKTRPDLLRLTRRGLGLGMVSGLVIVAAHLALYYGFLRDSEVFAGAPEILAEKLDGLGMNSPLKFCILAFFLSVIHSFLEEYFWRWYVFRQLRAWLGLSGATILSSLGFMAHHVIVLDAYIPREHFLVATLPLSLCVAIGGAWWCWLYEKSGSLSGPWLCHFWADVAIMITGYDWMWGIGSGA